MSKRLSVRLSGMKLDNKIRFRPKSLTYLFLVAFFVVGGFYVYTVNRVSNKGTQLNNLYESNKALDAENARLATEAARLASLQVIDQGATGEVQTGTEESKPAPTPGTTVSPAPEVQSQSITLTPAKPKLVLTQNQTYLPSYAGNLAVR